MIDNEWEGYGTCPVCHAAPDEPCIDADSWDQQEKAKAHRTRGLLTDDPIYQQGQRDILDDLDYLIDGQRWYSLDDVAVAHRLVQTARVTIKGKQS